MSLTGPTRATALYPRLKVSSGPTIDIPEPAITLPTQPPTVGLVGQNRVASGKTETLFGRLEESCGIALRCEVDIVEALRWFCEDYAFRGTQFQAWIDRFTGSCWMFENNRKDQNGLTLALGGGGTETYATGSVGTGIVLSSSQYLSVVMAQASAATPTGYDDPLSNAEGVIVLDLKPAYAASDGVVHTLLDTQPNSNCRLTIFKQNDATLHLQITDSASGTKEVAGAVTFASGDRVQIVASWSTAGAIALWYAVNGGAFVALTTATGAGTGLMTSLPTNLTIGATYTAGNLAPGTYDTVAIFKKAYATPYLSLANYRPWRRNYFPYGELIGFQYAPARATLGRQIYDWAMAFRNGVA